LQSDPEQNGAPCNHGEGETPSESEVQHNDSADSAVSVNQSSHSSNTGTSPLVGAELPTIDRICEGIHVGAGGTLVVPREDLGAEIDDASELDLASMIAQKIRKPWRREWIALNPASELTTRLLLHKPTANAFEDEYYYVLPTLRTKIRQELKDVRVFLYYSFWTRSFALWIVKVTLGNSWYENLASLFRHPTEFFASKAIRVSSDQEISRHRVWEMPMPYPVNWPAETTDQSLGEALGQKRFITTPDHPLYRDLIEGVELS
jgi:hypothetical protein